jgi:hypothetical protein
MLKSKGLNLHALLRCIVQVKKLKKPTWENDNKLNVTSSPTNHPGKLTL